MNIIQLFGDYIQLLGMIILLAKICLTRNCTGISGKTQLLYAMLFTMRYMDLTVRYISLYNTILKIICLGVAYSIVLSIFFFFGKTYDRKRDAFRIELLILPSAVFALCINYEFNTIEVFYAFSLYLEGVSIVPQIYLVSKSKQVESIVVSYISCIGLHRGCYLMQRLYRLFKHGDLDNIAIACDVVQLIFCCDFFTRNLPILKPKNCGANSLSANVADKELAMVNADIANGDKVVDLEKDTVQQDSHVVRGITDDGCAPDERPLNNKSLHSVVVLTPDTLTAEEKVTLLTPKETGPSN